MWRISGRREGLHFAYKAVEGPRNDWRFFFVLSAKNN
jgi:hypothetical protein